MAAVGFRRRGMMISAVMQTGCVQEEREDPHEVGAQRPGPSACLRCGAREGSAVPATLAALRGHGIIPKE